MDKQNNFRKKIWLGICAASFNAICALLMCTAFFKLYIIFKKIKPEGLSFLGILAISNYMFLYLVIILLIPCLFIAFVFKKPLKIFQALLFLFWTLVSVSFANFVYLEKIAKAASRSLLLPLLLFLLPVVIILIHSIIYRTKNSGKLILATLAGVIILCILVFLFDVREWLLPLLVKRHILLGSILSIVFAQAIILSWLLLYNFLRWIAKKVVYFKGKEKAPAYFKLTAVLLAISCGLAILGYLWDGRGGGQVNKRAVSRTTNDANAILIIIDALRPDHLGCYGYRRQTSPAIDNFAKEGVLFQNCYSATSFTKSSVASILTSWYESMHSVSFERQVLPESLVTLAEILHKNGYLTCAYIENGLLAAKFNYNQGFDFYFDAQLPQAGKPYYIAFRLIEHVALELARLTIRNFHYTESDKNKYFTRKEISWLAKFKNENFFMFIHYLNPHSPYLPPSPYNTMFFYPPGDSSSESMAKYDGEIRFVDAYLDELFKLLKSLGILDKTLIVITADHGEAFGEHGFYNHNNTLYQEEIRVPLIMKFGSSLPPGKVISRQVRSIDIMPTILDALGISYSGVMEGKSLLPLIKEDKMDKSRDYIFVELNDKKPHQKAVIKNNEWKLLFKGEEVTLTDTDRSEDVELYNLKTDPRESHNLAAQESGILEELLKELEHYMQYCKANAGESPAEIELDKETEQRLRSLGYLQ